MYETSAKIIQFINMNPLFKGGVVTIAGLLALLFAYWMRKKWHEPFKGGFGVFVALSIFITLYGLFILIFRPQWWALPY